jgi:hypothetical protein
MLKSKVLALVDSRAEAKNYQNWKNKNITFSSNAHFVGRSHQPPNHAQISFERVYTDIEKGLQMSWSLKMTTLDDSSEAKLRFKWYN